MDVDSLLASLEEELKKLDSLRGSEETSRQSPSPPKKLEKLQLQDVDALLEEMARPLGPSGGLQAAFMST